MKHNYSKSTAATGSKTAVKYVGKTNVAGTRCTNFEYPAETSIDVIIGLTDVCIEAAKMGKPTFAYTNMVTQTAVTFQLGCILYHTVKNGLITYDCNTFFCSGHCRI